jgi:hypothetical protein
MVDMWHKGAFISYKVLLYNSAFLYSLEVLFHVLDKLPHLLHKEEGDYGERDGKQY